MQTKAGVKPKRVIHENSLKNLIPPKKGECRNPNGAPRYKFAKEMLQTLLIEKAKKNGEEMDFSILEVIHKAQIKRAAQGDTRAYTEILNRIEGKPIERQIVINTNEQMLKEMNDDERREAYEKYKLYANTIGIDLRANDEDDEEE